MENNELKKESAQAWFRNLRDQFCAAFKEIDSGSFERKTWKHKGNGGGEISIMKGNVFEKVGVNISTRYLPKVLAFYDKNNYYQKRKNFNNSKNNSMMLLL